MLLASPFNPLLSNDAHADVVVDRLISGAGSGMVTIATYYSPIQWDITFPVAYRGQQISDPVMYARVQNGDGCDAQLNGFFETGLDGSPVITAVDADSLMGVTPPGTNVNGNYYRFDFSGQTLSVPQDGVLWFQYNANNGSCTDLVWADSQANPYTSIIGQSTWAYDYYYAVFAITDATTSYTVGGTVSGLTGTGLVLQNNGAEALPIAADGSFTFLTGLTETSSYSVTVSTQPMGQTCDVTNGSGVISEADITDVVVTCEDDVVAPIPTASQWGLIMLSMLMGLVVFASRKRLF